MRDQCCLRVKNLAGASGHKNLVMSHKNCFPTCNQKLDHHMWWVSPENACCRLFSVSLADETFWILNLYLALLTLKTPMFFRTPPHTCSFDKFCNWWPALTRQFSERTVHYEQNTLGSASLGASPPHGEETANKSKWKVWKNRWSPFRGDHLHICPPAVMLTISIWK